MKCSACNNTLPLFSLALLTFFCIYAVNAQPFAEFVAQCPSSHVNFDDPIVYPGRPGQSHSHTFYATVDVNADTVFADLADGETTCSVPEDHSSYWHPTLTVDGERCMEDRTFFYYQNSHNEPEKVIPFPRGLKVIAGNSTALESFDADNVHWACLNENKASVEIPTCEEALELFVRFPSCWDGLNRDSPDHKRHMAYPDDGECPETHPNRVPSLEVKIIFTCKGGPGTEISSGTPYSLHADFWNGWEDEAMEMRIRNCIWQTDKCGSDGIPQNSEPADQSVPFEPRVVPAGTPNYGDTVEDPLDGGDGGDGEDGDDGDDGDDGGDGGDGGDGTLNQR
ncbi:putative Telomere repeat-binding zinc finger protein [Balamuthia mandrillaris]